MRTRRAARKLALDVLYEAEIRDELPVEAFEARRSGGWVIPAPEDDAGAALIEEAPPPEAVSFALELLEGVQKHQAEIDALIVGYSDHWTIERMPVIDRNLLRMGLYELLWAEGIPVAVAINEAVELAKALSTDDSGRFINGLLGRVVEREGLE
ncbi:MAG: transcription antitermination factor NusB [Actinomycetota bacterium]